MIMQTHRQFQQGLFADPLDIDPFLSPEGQLPAENTNNVNAHDNTASRKYLKKKKAKPTTRIAKYGTMLDDEGKCFEIYFFKQSETVAKILNLFRLFIA